MYMSVNKCKELLINGEFDGIFKAIYGEDEIDFQHKRYLEAIDNFCKLYGNDRDIALFSVPGRSEISGNHTDHNHGCVIAASVNLDIIAVAAVSDTNVIRIKSAGFDEDIVDLADIKPDELYFFTSRAVIAGMCGGFDNRGFNYGGFDAYTTSNVLKGSGLSSSAAFEVMVGNILNHFYNDGKIDAPEIAKISQYSENVYFGKPCGLMDQTACAVGGFVTIDFNDPTKPIIEKLDFDMTAQGYSLCIVDTGGNHADLNDDYASIPSEMKKIASYYGQEHLRGLTYTDIMSRISEFRGNVSDRAILRSLHFIEENDRVAVQVEALKNGDLDKFLDGVTASGNSSYKKLQNIFTVKNVEEQGLSLALAIAENVLGDKETACRVHGGGFAGTIQAFMPNEIVAEFTEAMNSVFGDGACIKLNIRPYGAIKIN
jgi:Galactokinase